MAWMEFAEVTNKTDIVEIEDELTNVIPEDNYRVVTEHPEEITLVEIATGEGNSWEEVMVITEEHNPFKLMEEFASELGEGYRAVNDWTNNRLLVERWNDD